MPEISQGDEDKDSIEENCLVEGPLFEDFLERDSQANSSFGQENENQISEDNDLCPNMTTKQEIKAELSNMEFPKVINNIPLNK